MARIRTIKPEAFTSESLAAVRVQAERTFYGLLTQADDRGRHRDNAAVIAGALWPLRPEHTPAHVEEDLRQLAEAKLICRYTGCDGKRYLHFPTWDQHQKINKPSESRQPVCRDHEPDARCGHCKKTDCPSRQTFPEGSGNTPGGFPEGSGNTPGGFREGSNHAPEPERNGTAPAQAAIEGAKESTAEPPQETTGHSLDHQDSGSPPVGLPEGSGPGSRIVDLGPRSSDYVGAAEAARAPEPVTAQTLIAEWLDHCAKRPPKDVIGQISKLIKKLLEEGIEPDDVRRGLALWMRKGLHPSTLPSVVNEAMNAQQSALLAAAGAENVVHLVPGQRLTGPDARIAEHMALTQHLRALEARQENS